MAELEKRSDFEMIEGRTKISRSGVTSKDKKFV